MEVLWADVTEGSALQKRTGYLYDNNHNLSAQRNYYGDLAAKNTYDELAFTYGNYSPLPISKRITGVRDAVGNPAYNNGVWEEKTTYDSYGRATVHTNAQGYTTQLTYDGLGRITQRRNHDGSVQKFDYSISPNQVIQTDERGDRKKTVYNALGQVYQVCALDPETKLEQYEYDALGRVSKEYTYNANGGATASYSYDAFGRVLSKTVTGSEVNEKETHTYNDVYENRGMLETKTTQGDAYAAALVSSVVQSPVGYILEERVGNAGNSQSITYWTRDKLGNPKTMIAPQTGKSEYTCNYAGQIVKEVNGDQKPRTNTYNALNQKVRASDWFGRESIYTYDKVGKLIKEEVPFAAGVMAVTRYFYDGAGNMVRQDTQCNAVGAAQKWRRVDHKYDSRGRVTDVIAYEENGAEVRNHYDYEDSAHRKTMYVGARSSNMSGAQKTIYTYDRFGNTTSLADASGRTERFHYDATGLMTGRTDRNGSVTTITRDGLGRVRTETVRNSSGAVTGSAVFTYTATGQKRTEQNDALTSTFYYDDHGRLIKQTESDGVVKNYTYDTGGNRKTFVLTKNNATQINLSYDYDVLGRLTQVKDASQSSAVIARYTYDNNGNRKTLTYPLNNTSVRYDYNYANLVTLLENTRGGTVLSRWTYGYQLDGNQISKTDKDNKTTTYTYDSLSQLTKEADPANNTMVYTYNQFGNRVKMTVTGQEQYESVYTYDVCNRMEQCVKEYTDTVETSTYTYDANGNQIRSLWQKTAPAESSEKGRVNFAAGEQKYGEPTLERREYNGFNQLTQVYRDGQLTRYRYRPDGMRYSKSTDSTTIHHWDGQDIVMESAGNGVVKSKYLRGIGLIACHMDSQYQYYLHNAHGDVVHRVDGYGNTLRTYGYDSFGNELKPEPLDPNPFRYCGEYLDQETQSVYLRNRYYNPRMGRFLSEDVARDGLNWYTYCGNNPVRFIDPQGTTKRLTLEEYFKSVEYKVFEESVNEDPRALEAHVVEKSFAYDWAGPHVDYRFKYEVYRISQELGIDPDDLMMVMASESRLEPDRWNYNKDAVGLIQFTHDGLQGMGTNLSLDAIAAMSAIEQLDYVYEYLKPHIGKMDNAGDIYVAVFAPYSGAMGASDDHVMYTKGRRGYSGNSAMDFNQDGYITRGELITFLSHRLDDYWDNIS